MRVKFLLKIFSSFFHTKEAKKKETMEYNLLKKIDNKAKKMTFCYGFQEDLLLLGFNEDSFLNFLEISSVESEPATLLVDGVLHHPVLYAHPHFMSFLYTFDVFRPFEVYLRRASISFPESVQAYGFDAGDNKFIVQAKFFNTFLK